MSQYQTAHAASVQQTLKVVETNLSSLGTGPYTPEQAEKVQELNQLKQKLCQIQATGGTTAGFNLQQQAAKPIVMNQPSPAPVSNMIPGMVTQTTIKTELQPAVVLSQGSATSAAIEDDKILSKQRLHELVKDIDPNEQLDDDVEEMLMQITDDFIESVVASACDLARHRNSSVLEVKDMKFHLENHWNIDVLGYGSDEIKPFKKTVSTEAHKQRLALIRKATKK
ncbi:transcription initiation factor TFIID subunit 12-like isoform X2 [Styela clava]